MTLTEKLAELERLADAATRITDVWYSRDDLAKWIELEEDIYFIAALSPEVVKALAGAVQALRFYADKGSWDFTWRESVDGDDDVEVADTIDSDDVEIPANKDDETKPWVAGKLAREALAALAKAMGVER